MKYSTLLSIAAITLWALISLAVPAQAATIAITYSYAGTATGPQVISGTTLTVEHLLNGSILFGNPGLNATLNPVTGQDHDVIDLTTGILDGSVTFMFANGETLFGNQHVVGLAASSQMQVLTFFGGTGEFANATGSASGIASLTSDGYMVSGGGVINTAAVPEPASAAFFGAGLALLMIKWRCITARVSRSGSSRQL
jgi:hypothetical protein